jgi:RimJ/RimL family protein N-acetyltransferase
MIRPLFDGTKISLSALDLEKDAAILARWTHDPNYLQLMGQEPARPMTPGQLKKRIPEEDKPENQHFRFAIRTLDENRLVGVVALHWIEYSNGYAWLTLGIGAPQDRGKGYGREALRLILNFAFNELNLHRVNCWLGEYNVTAQHLLESQGFQLEVRSRQAIHRFERRFDGLLMGALQSDWLAMQEKPQVLP